MNHIDYEITKELGECYLFMGEFDKARDYYRRAMESNPQMYDPYMGLAAVAVNSGDLEEAYALYEKANAISPGEKPLTGIGMIALELGRHEEAFARFQEALRENPGNMVAVNGLLQLAYVLDRLEDAIPFLESALETGDTEAVRYALAASHLTMGHEDEARNHLELLLGDNPHNDSAKQLYAHLAA
jgi:tetratricopeptide (TPR) repeat protein